MNVSGFKRICTILIAQAMVMGQLSPVLADTNYSFTQTDWLTGVSSDTAIHPTNQNNWQKYSSKDTNIDTSYPGRAVMSRASTQITDDTDTDFGAGTLDHVQVSGTGTAAKVQLVATTNDPFSNTLGQWQNLPNIPGIGNGAAFAIVKDYPNSGDYFVYVMWSGVSARTVFSRWNCNTEQWEFLTDFPKAIADGSYGNGAVMCYPGSGDFIYALRGNMTKDFYKYSIAGNTWAKCSDAPYYAKWGSGLAAKTSAAIFMTFGRDDNGFYQYNTATNNWTQRQNLPWTLGEGSNIVYPGTGDNIYCNRGYNTTSFARYSITGNAWTDLSATLPVPYAMNYNSTFNYPGADNYIYGTPTDNGIEYIRFNFSTQAWESSPASLPRLPLRNTWGRGFFYYKSGANPKICWMKFARYTKPYSYDITNNKWDDLSCCWDLPAWGARMAWDGSNYIYFNYGQGSTNFYRYSLPANKWEALAAIPFNQFQGGGGITYYNGLVYCWAGNGNSNFASYNPGNNTWTNLTAAPASLNWGAYMIGVNVSGTDYIYALRGSQTQTFWRYNISGNTWENRANTPAIVYEGGCIAYTGSGDYFYILAGNGTNVFWKYSLSGDSWATLSNIPAPTNGVRADDTLLYPGTGDYLYWLRSTDAWNYTPFAMARYSMSGDSWVTLPNKPFGGIAAYAVTNNYIYGMTSSNWGMYRYDLSAGAWDNPEVESAGILYGQTVLGPDNDTVYSIGGNTGYRQLVWKYSLSQKKWLNFITAPFYPYYGTSACYPGSDKYIYVLEGSHTPNLWRLDTSNDTWAKMAAAPYSFYLGAQLTGNGNTLYAIRGWWGANTRTFMQYSITSDVWSTGTDTPSDIGGRDKRCLVYPGGQYVYLLRAEGDTLFWRYDTNNNTWLALKAAPVNFDTNSTLFSLGSGDLYASQGNNFYKYSLSSDSWSTLTSVPYHDIGFSFFYPTTGGDILYSVGGNWRTDIQRYSLSQDSWDQPLSLPSIPYYGSAMAALNDGDTIFYRPGGGSANFYQYSISGRTWTAKTASPTGVDEWSSRMTSDGKDYVYATRGRYRFDFWRFSVAENKWYTLANAPADFRTGHDICYKNGYVYAIRGESQSLFRFNVGTGLWETRANVPGAVSWGGRLVSGDGNYIYCVKGNASDNFYRYDTSNDTWTTPTNTMPVKVGYNGNDSSALCYPGFGDYIYYMLGTNWSTSEGEQKNFLRYTISQDKWDDLEGTPYPGRSDCALVYPGQGNSLYADSGYNTPQEFWRYLAFSSGTYVSKIKEVGNNNGFGIITWNDNGVGSIEVKARTSNYSNMSDAMAWGACPAITKGTDLSNYNSVVDGHKYIQYRVKLITNDLAQLPALDNITINYEYYLHQQTLISSAYNSTYSSNRLMKLGWTETQPTGTDVRFQLRTAPDNNGQPGAWGPWLGPGGTQSFNDDYSTPGSYAYSSEIEITGGLARLKKVLQDYAYTQRVILDNSQGSTSYTNSVVTINIDYSNLDFWAHVKNDGSDVRFVDSQGNLLGYNIATNGAGFDYVNKIAKIYVKVASVPAALKTSIYLKYGKSDAVSATDPTVLPFLYFDDFSSPVLSKYSYGRAYFESGAVRLLGNSDWTSCYLTYSNNTFTRDPQGTVFEASFKQETTNQATMIGWKNNNADPNYTQMTYAIYFENNGSIYIYEDGNSRGQVTTNYTYGNWYDVKIVLDPVQGAKYYYRLTGAPAWTLIYTSVYSAATNLKPHITQHGRGVVNAYVDNWKVYTGSGAQGINIPVYFYTLEEQQTSPSLSGWNKRLTVRIDNTAGGNITNYQVKVLISPSQESFWSACKSDGTDIRVVDSDNTTVLYDWRVAFDYTNKAATLWARVPSVPAGQVKTIYLYYGRSDASDTSSYNSAMTKDFEEAARNNAGVSLDGVDDVVNVAHSSSLNISNLITVEANVKYVADTWLPGYGYRKKATLNNTSGPAYTNQVVKFDVAYVPGKMSASYADLRFVDTDGTKLVYRIYTYDASKATVLVMVPSIPAASTKDINLYYGNAGALDESDASLNSVPLSGLVGYWKFDEGIGSSAADSSGQNNTGTLVNSPAWVAGKNGTALQFNGSNNYVNVGNGASLKFSLPFTFCMWINLPVGIDGNWRNLISSATWGGSPGYDTMINSNQQLIMTVNGGECTQPRPNFGITTAAWHHITYTVSASTCKIYIDGILRSTFNGSWSLSASPNNTWIGFSPAGGYSYFQGAMDDVIIYNRELSITEVQDVMNSSGVSNIPVNLASEETQPAVNQTIISKSGAYELKFTQGGVTATVNSTSVSTPMFDAGKFMHTALSYDGTTLKLFVNGALKNSTPLSGAIVTNTNNLVIGDKIKGGIDEIKVWNRAKPNGEVSADQKKRLAGNENGLIMYLFCNENSGTTAYDLTTNANNGTLGGGAGWYIRPFAYSNEKAASLYHMDEGTGLASVDSSGNNNTLSVNNANWDSTDLTGFTPAFSLSFNGTNSYLQAADSASLELTGEVSLEAWVRPQRVSGIQTIVEKGDDTQNLRNYALYLSGDQVGFSFYNAGYKSHVSTAAALQPLNTYYIVATFNEATDTVKMYVNGLEVYSGQQTSNMLTGSNPILIGKSVSGNFYQGLLDEARVYNRALSANEIMAHYLHRKYAFFEPEPTLYFDFEPEFIPEVGAYAKDNPVAQPIIGVFYTNKNIAEFTEISNKPLGTAIKYQVSKDGYKWYYHNGTSWAEVSGGYSQTNTAAEINANLTVFQNNLASEGDFYYRAYLHSDENAFSTPSLDNLAITLVTGETYYVDPAGVAAINYLHTDANNDQWFQYKALLYSDGTQTPLLEDISMEYLNAYLTLASPNGRETYTVGQSVNITWSSQAITGATGNVKLEYSPDGGNTYKTVAASTANTGTYPWTVPDDPSQNVLLKITSVDFPVISDTSNAAFSILSLIITSPNGGEVWEVGKQHAIRWTTSGTVSSNLTIQYSVNNGTTWTNVSTQRPNTGVYNWIVPGTTSDTVLIKIFDANNLNITDVSDAVLAIVPVPAIVINAPVGGEQWKYGTAHTISWRANQKQISDQVKLQYSRDDFGSDIHDIIQVSVGTPQGSNPNDDIIGTYNWTMPDAVNSNVKVRVIEVAAPPGRDTQDIISGKSNIFSIIEPTISVSAPVSSDIWVVGDTHAITWSTDGQVSNNLLLEYSADGGLSWTHIATGEANDGTYDWTIPSGAAGNSISIRITDASRTQVKGASEPFNILAYPTIKITQPNGGEYVVIGTTYDIKWQSWGSKLQQNGPDYFSIAVYYSTNNGTSWTLITDQQANDGEYTWDVPDSETNQALIKIVDANDAQVVDTSDAVFNIALPSITLTSPNGGEIWYATGNYTITWSSVGMVSNNLKLEYSTDNGSSWHLIATGEHNDGSYVWNVADVDTGQALVRITDASRPTVTDTSNAAFYIKPPEITIISPNGSEEWVVGTEHEISWVSAGKDYGAIRDNLTLQYSSNGGTSWTAIAVGENNDGSYLWTIPDNVSGTCKVKIFDASRPATIDTSDANFSISLPYIQVLSPNGGETWVIGTQHDITWRAVGTISDNLKIEYSKDNFSTSTVISNGEANDGIYTWTSVPNDYSTTVKVRITDNNRTQITDMSDASFSIANPIIHVTRPNGGELLTVDDVEAITWENTGSVGNSLKIEYSKDNFFSPGIVIAEDAPNTGTANWRIPSDVSATVKIRITDNGRQVVWDKSDANFTILPKPVITITAPNGGEVWRVGTPRNIIWTDNGGLISNNLTIEYSTNGGGAWQVITNSYANAGSYGWTVPDNVSATCLIRITDASRPTTTDTSDEAFQIADPLITVTSPNGGEAWAVGDNAPVTWTTEGSVSNNLVLEWSPDGGSNYYLVRAGVSNTGTFNWVIPDQTTPNALFRIKDGNRLATFDVSDKTFVVNPMPTFTVTAPNGGEQYVLGDATDITWTWTGLSISNNIVIDCSNDNFVNTRKVIATGLPNNGKYTWHIPADALTGKTLKVRIMDGNRTQIQDISDGYFLIRGGFTIVAPNGGENWVAKSPQSVTWQTRGTVSKVTLEYTVDNGTTWNLVAASVDNTGSYTWNLPDIQHQSVPVAPVQAKVRVTDPDDPSVTASSVNNFNIVYATVKFSLLDYDTLQHLADFGVSEPNTGWNDTGLASPITRTQAYPYGTYTTFFTKSNYIDNSATWSPPKIGTDTYVVTIYMENSASAQVTWDAILTYSYSPADDTLNAVGSLQRKGKLVGTTEMERSDMGPAIFTIYQPDGVTVRKTLTSATPSSSTGMYSFTYSGTLFGSGQVYPATLSIEYRSRPYISQANIDVGAEKLQYEFFTKTAAELSSSVQEIKSAVGEGTAAMQRDLAATKNEIKAETGKILSATGTASIPDQIAATQDKIDTSMKSEILNRENYVRSGQDLTIRYRTYSGLAPTMDVYDATNKQRVTAANMKEIGTTGIYEYDVTFSSAWGMGDFTVVCSEATKGTLDALIISVLRTDLEQIASNISGIMGTTSGISSLKTVADSLNSQFSIIETALSKVGKDLIGEVRDATGSATALESVHSQLSSVAKQIQGIVGESGVNLQKLFDVSEQKKEDITYLKNKTQQLKAAMEISSKMIDNIANKPITQTWYEYQ